MTIQDVTNLIIAITGLCLTVLTNGEKFLEKLTSLVSAYKKLKSKVKKKEGET